MDYCDFCGEKGQMAFEQGGAKFCNMECALRYLLDHVADLDKVTHSHNQEDY